MRYPENLKIGDTIGICAPSDGIADEFRLARLDLAIENLKNLGYKVIETESVRKSIKGRSTDAKKRAKEFMELMENTKVKLILYAGGGDFLMEMLDELDFEKLKKLPPKWIQGFSDITNLGFLFNTILDVPSMYCEAVKDYAMKPLYRNLKDSLKIMSGEEVIQNSFEKYEEEANKSIPEAPYNLTKKVKWKNIKGEEEIVLQGRALGGCFDVIECLIGTKYDYIKEYIEKYKKDGIIWFLECYEMTTPQVERKLWQMKNSGYFENVNGIIFGRPLYIREDYEISFEEAVYEQTKDLGIPIICGVDIGHVPPQLAIVNGAILKITSKNGKGTVETYLE